jgi:hypothetical protein
MRRSLILLAVVAAVIGAAAVVRADPPPPQGSKPLSEILRTIEGSPDFGYFDEIELERGSYKIEYYARDGSKRKINVDPVTGSQR